MQGLSYMTNRRHKDDYYPTPPEAVEALLAVEQFNARVWEPACGAGHISRVLQQHKHRVISTDLNNFGFGETGIDFLFESDKRAETIITNPPYKLANQFVRHAINIGIKKHAWLLRLAFLEGQARYDMLYKANPPASVHVFTKRLTIWRGDEDRAWYGTTGKTPYAWFVWDSGVTDTKVTWL